MDDASKDFRDGIESSLIHTEGHVILPLGPCMGGESRGAEHPAPGLETLNPSTPRHPRNCYIQE